MPTPIGARQPAGLPCALAALRSPTHGSARHGRVVAAWTAAVAAVVLAWGGATPEAAAAQLRPRPAGPTGWPPVEIGVRVGYDNIQRQEVLGGIVRIPVVRGGSVELMPNGDVTFLRGLKEYQLNLEAVYLLTAGEGGLYAGGGFGFRSTIPPSDLEGRRRTLTTWQVVVGVKLTGFERVNPLIEFRRVFASELAVDPQLVSLGVTLELW